MVESQYNTEKVRTYDEMLNAIYFKKRKQYLIARDMGKSPSWISQNAKTLQQLAYKPRTLENKLICYFCETDSQLRFKLDIESGRFIALVCKDCLNRNLYTEMLNFDTRLKKAYLQFNAFFKKIANHYENWTKDLHLDDFIELMDEELDIDEIEKINKHIGVD
jgi:hypothetical protein